MNWLQRRKERRASIRAHVHDRETKFKLDNSELIAKNPGDKSALKELKKSFKNDTKAIKKSYKHEGEGSKRTRRLRAKYFKKYSNRQRSRFIKGFVAACLLLVAVNYGGIVVNLYGMLTGKDITMDSSTPQAKIAMAKGEELSEKLVDEGIVLLKNDDNHLPYGEKKVNVFGSTSLNIRFGGGGSGATDISKAVGLYPALKDAGVTYNQELYEYYNDISGGEKASEVGVIQVLKGLLGMSGKEEAPVQAIDSQVLENAKKYSDSALIVITSSGTEASDFTPEQLKVSQASRDLIDTVSENFEKITLIVNAGNALELGFIEDYPQIKSVVWVGTPGPFGMLSLANVLKGNINPSGHLTDTYAYDSQLAPATVNFGDYKYTNLNKSFINYQEGIYVGYRFFETFYENDPVGYSSAVQFPFGHGLSYSNFEQKITNVSHQDDSIFLSVEVKNSGDVEGKDVVQIYGSAPYIPGGIEKSAIELLDFQKTVSLKSGETQTLSFEIDYRQMASYDTYGEQAYVLDSGKYSLKLGDNVHDIVDRYDFEMKEKIVFKNNDVTNTPYQNQFDYVEGAIQYLSRNDWENTWPNDEKISFEASEFVLENIDKVEPDNSISEPLYKQDNGLVLKDMVGLSRDDAKWDAFMDQFSIDEMIEFVSHGAYKTKANERLGIDKTLLMDGPAGFSYFFGSYEAAGYPSELLVASTWNKELSYEFGATVGNEAQAYGIQGWYAPAMNLHRTPQGGRNFEYFSEDPIISGMIGASITQGATDQGIMVFMKHFVMNDQETNARNGILVWSNEQAMRELYLKPFEFTVKTTDVEAAMSSFSYLGHKWVGANKDVLVDVLRDEWGFDGFVSTDAFFGFMSSVNAIQSGNELMLDILSPTQNEKKIKKAYKENPNAIGNALRNSVKTVLQTFVDNGNIVK